LIIVAGTMLALTAPGCHRDREGLREWTADDHDRTDDPSGAGATRPARAPANVAPHANAQAAPPGSGNAPGMQPPGAAANDLAALVDVTWRTQCALCHGTSGKGDGPQGPLLHASDLTAAEFQSKISDEQMAQSITQGKNRMPKFDLPPE